MAAELDRVSVLSCRSMRAPGCCSSSWSLGLTRPPPMLNCNALQIRGIYERDLQRSSTVYRSWRMEM